MIVCGHHLHPANKLCNNRCCVMIAKSCWWSAEQGKKVFFSLLPVRAREFGLARKVRQSRPASARPFSVPRLKLVLTRGLFSSSPPRFPRLRCRIYTAKRPEVPVQSFIRPRGKCVPMRSTAEKPPAQGGPVVPKVARGTVRCQVTPWTTSCAALFSHIRLLITS